MELVYLKDRMWCIYIHHRVWICYPNVVRRYGRGMSATCPLRAEMSHMWPCQEMRKHVVLPLTPTLTPCASAEQDYLQHVFSRAIAAILLRHVRIEFLVPSC